MEESSSYFRGLKTKVENRKLKKKGVKLGFILNSGWREAGRGQSK